MKSIPRLKVLFITYLSYNDALTPIMKLLCPDTLLNWKIHCKQRSIKNRAKMELFAHTQICIYTDAFQALLLMI